MSKIKIIDLNKQLKKRSKETVDKMESLQNSVQSHLATLKRIEVELIQIARQEAEEKKLREDREAAAKKVRTEQVDAEPKKSEQQVAAKQQENEPAANATEEKAEAEKAAAKKAVEEKTEKEVAKVKTAETNTKGRPQDMRVQKRQEARPQSVEQRPQSSDRRPQSSDRRPQSGDRRPQSGDRRPQSGDRRPQSGDRRPQSGDRRPQSGDRRPQSGDRRPQSGDRRPQSGDRRPQSGDRRPQSGDRRPQSGDRRPQGQQNRPQGQQNRPQGQQNRPQGQQNRPQGQRSQSSSGSSGFVHVDKKKHFNKKQNSHNNYDHSRRSKKIKEKGVFEVDERYRSRKRTKKSVQAVPIAPIVIDHVVMTTEMISVKSLAEKSGKPVAALLKKLLLLGIMATINSELDFDTAQLICDEFGITLEHKLEKTAEDVLDEGHQKDDKKDLENRPPIVTIMGHVDHGKTSLLDAIRQTRVTEHEAGGITQHIGAYQIEQEGNTITFLDTPGHEAFTAMRARGAQATDIAILVVAADDGVMPQTIEAINHAKAADVPIIVAINKIDKEGANPERIKQELTEHGLVAEEWGGETVMVPVSAITKQGLDQLLEMIVLVAEVQELKANPNRLANGTIIEAKLDKGRGPVATVLVKNGTLHIQDMIVAGTAYGRVRAMVDDMGRRVDEVGPAQPVEVVGFSEVPIAGDVLHAVEQDKLTRQVAEERKDKQKADMLKNLSKASLDDLFGQVQEGKMQDLNLIIKADVQGSVEAVRQALEKLKNEEVRVKIIHAGVGAIKAMDVMLASTSNAIVIGFNVRPDSMARVEAEKEKVEIRLYRVIYKAIEDIELAMKGMLAPEFKEAILGHAEVRNIFNVSSIGTIAGSYVTDGKIKKSSNVRLLRDHVVVHEGELASLKRFKDDAKEVNQGYECGITIKNYNDIKEGDVIEAFEMQEIER